MRRVFSAVVFGFGLALVAITAVSAQNPGGSPDGKKMKNPVASSADSIAAGQALFTKNCRFCHGADAKGAQNVTMRLFVDRSTHLPIMITWQAPAPPQVGPTARPR